MNKPSHWTVVVAKSCLVLAWAVLILVLMTKPMPVVESSAKGFTVSDKLTHIFLFGPLVWLTLDAWRSWRGQVDKLTYILIVGSSLAFAYGGEYLQQFIPSRNASIYDLSFGFLGMVLAAIIFARWHRAKPVKPKLLLHLCCGPCGSQLSDDLRKDYEVTLLFANSNIDTEAEYKKRLAAARQAAKHYRLPLIVEEYNHEEWSELIKGWESEPERGRRCLLCYRYRLNQAVSKCLELGFDYYASSLSVSPHKDGLAVIQIGRELSAGLPLRFLETNFSQNGGFTRSVAAAKRLRLYRQNYCGCEFSRRPAIDKK